MKSSISPPLRSGQEDPKALFHESWDKSQLRREYPPQFLHPHKQLLYDIAYASEVHDAGELQVSRWTSTVPDALECGNTMRVRTQAGYFDYLPQSATQWTLNFADTSLFFAYGGSLFAQDEIQVAEHPLLGCVREKLARLARHSAAHAPRTRAGDGTPTPVLIQGAERCIAVAVNADTAAGRPDGLYGNRFASAPRAAIIRATTRLAIPTRSNLLAIAAPAYGHGEYCAETVSDALRTSWSGFRAVVQTCGPVDSATIHTGNWGCGAFGGNLELMYLAQLLAGAWAAVGELVFHAPHAALFDAAHAKFVQLHKRGCGYDEALEYLLAQRYRWGVSDGN